ncbi:hypothetical protein BaRGS_00011112 [Batillaria attramentaria]|uniref:Uncharacterized protein n=1 Tax=Batillaria attramentaria TaxID=370345 RepID=A0ABD0LDS6_9CAEN
MAAPFSKSAPSTKLVFEKSNFSHQNNNHENIIKGKYFTYAASIILPFNTSLPSVLGEIADQQSACLIKSVPLHHLVDKEFVEGFVKRGCLYILSHGTRIDTQDCVALIPTGHLILHVTKDTYQQLGLEGRPSQYASRGKPSKYVVDVDLTPDFFTPGRKNYDRVLWCLKDRLNLTFDLLVAWTPHEEAICPSSVPKYFESKGFIVTPVPTSAQVQWQTSIQMPVLSSAVSKATEDSCGREALWEWLGAVACGIDMSEASADSYISTLACPTPSVNCPRCCVIHLSGFLTPAASLWLLKKVRSEVEQAEGGVRWASVTLHGFLDSPVSAKSREHGFFLEGDNVHSFVVFSNKDYWLYSAYGHHDVCQ